MQLILVFMKYVTFKILVTVHFSWVLNFPGNGKHNMLKMPGIPWILAYFWNGNKKHFTMQL